MHWLERSQGFLCFFWYFFNLVLGASVFIGDCCFISMTWLCHPNYSEKGKCQGKRKLVNYAQGLDISKYIIHSLDFAFSVFVFVVKEKVCLDTAMLISTVKFGIC